MEVLIDLGKLRHNISVLQAICRDAGLQVVWVTKGCHSYPAVIGLLGEMGAEIIGDAYVQNFQSILGAFPGELMMICFPTLSQTAEAVAGADTNLISCADHAAALSRAAQVVGQKQQVILMVDVGNLREGVMPHRILPVVKKILALPGIELAGLGTSVGCFGGYCVGLKDMETLLRIAEETEESVNIKLPVISVASGTMILDLIREGKIPEGINQVRIGAGFLVGEKPPTKEPIAQLDQGAFILRTEIVERMRKPSLPGTQTGRDAFGRTISFEDFGDRSKALLNIGVVDVDVYDLTPITSGVRIVGASSNYTICDVTDCTEKLEVGRHLDFRMGYSAMSKAMASKYTQKTVIA